MTADIFLIARLVFMKIPKSIALAALLAGATFAAEAQTNVITVTNIVTVTYTNIVTVTNVVDASPVTAPVAAVETNAPVVEPPEPKYPWESSVGAGLVLTRGNSHTLLYSGEIETAKKTPENEYSLGASGAYGSQNSKDNVNNYGAYGQWNHLFTERFYSYVRAEYKRDLIADLDYRFNVGPGAGYYLMKMTNTTLAVEAGAGYQYEHLGGEYNSFATARFAENFEHKFSNRGRVWQKVELLPQVDEFDNYVLNFEIGAEASLTTVLSLKTTLQDTYQSQPAAGRDKNDIKIISRISYKF